MPVKVILTLKEDHKPRVFQNKFIMRIFVSKRDEGKEQNFFSVAS
jgi:hypothetical protein